MKNIFKTFFVAVLIAGLLNSCKKDFEEINKDPDSPTQTVPDYLFTNLVRNIGYKGNTCLYLYNPQTLPITRLGVYAAGTKDDIETPSNTSGSETIWGQFYGVLADGIDLKKTIEKSVATPERHRNQLAMIDIYLSYYALRVLETFGDAPFQEAGLGFHELIFTPSYDGQGATYLSILETLKNASAAIVIADKTADDESYLDFEANTKFTGNSDKLAHFTFWKKFANALLLKHAVRVSKFDAAKAAEYAAAALTGPQMESRDDSAALVPGNLSDNAKYNAWAWSRYYGQQYLPGQFLASKLVDASDIANVDPSSDDVFDPRFFGIYFPNQDGDYAILPNSPDAVADAAYTGTHMPNGENAETIIADHTAEGYTASHASWNRMYVTSTRADQQMLTYAEYCLVRAEAYAQGLVSGDAKAWFETGVRAAVEDFFHEETTNFPGNNGSRLIDVTAAQVDDLVTKLNADFDADNLLAIRTQRWINYLERPEEAWSLIRRTNLFDLDNSVPLVVDGQALSMIYRVKYPADEAVYNQSNYLDQINKMGGTDDIRYKSDLFK